MNQRNDIPVSTNIEQTLDAVESAIGDLQATSDGLPDGQESPGYAGFDSEVPSTPQPGPFVGYQAELAEKAAQIDATTAAIGLTSPVPTPPPKRPKGRLVIGGFLFALLVAGFYIVWDGVFRYAAYEVVAVEHYGAIVAPVPTSCHLHMTHPHRPIQSAWAQGLN